MKYYRAGAFVGAHSFEQITERGLAQTVFPDKIKTLGKEYPLNYTFEGINYRFDYVEGCYYCSYHGVENLKPVRVYTNGVLIVDVDARGNGEMRVTDQQTFDRDHLQPEKNQWVPLDATVRVYTLEDVLDRMKCPIEVMNCGKYERVGVYGPEGQPKWEPKWYKLQICATAEEFYMNQYEYLIRTATKFLIINKVCFEALFGRVWCDEKVQKQSPSS